MSPKRLKSNEFKKVENMLIDFYQQRPDSYGLLERAESDYQSYFAIINSIFPDKKGKLLDVGSGTWRIPQGIADLGFENVTGLDYFSDEKLLDYTNKITNKNAKLITYQNGKIPLEDNSVDYICSLCVVEHIVFVEDFFNEINRVLKPNGIHLIVCPNWSSILVPISGIMSYLKGNKRFWQYSNIFDSFLGIFRSIKWYVESLVFSNNFILIYPRIQNNQIDFELSDDDAVHLCQPISIRKFYENLNFETLLYNKGYGTTKFTKVFNNIFPSFASTNVLAFKKNKE